MFSITNFFFQTVVWLPAMCRSVLSLTLLLLLPDPPLQCCNYYNDFCDTMEEQEESSSRVRRETNLLHSDKKDLARKVRLG